MSTYTYVPQKSGWYVLITTPEGGEYVPDLTQVLCNLQKFAT